MMRRLNRAHRVERLLPSQSNRVNGDAAPAEQGTSCRELAAEPVESSEWR